MTRNTAETDTTTARHTDTCQQAARGDRQRQRTATPAEPAQPCNWQLWLAEQAEGAD